MLENGIWGHSMTTCLDAIDIFNIDLERGQKLDFFGAPTTFSCPRSHWMSSFWVCQILKSEHFSVFKIVSKFDLGLVNAYKRIYFDRNVNGNKTTAFLKIKPRTKPWLLCLPWWPCCVLNKETYFINLSKLPPTCVLG